MARFVMVQRVLGILAAIVLAGGAVYVFRWAGESPDPTAVPTTSASIATDLKLRAGAGRVATTGPGLTEPGVHVLTQPDADGNLEVVERIRLGAPVGGLTITPPRSMADGGVGPQPTISGFQAEADGTLVTDTPESPMSASADYIVLPSSSIEISMRYRLEGATARSEPAPVGRVLVNLPPIAASGLGTLPVVVEVVGATVRNLVCPDLPTNAQLCGRQHGQVWSTVALPAAESSVIAQIDLPRPGAT